MQHILDAALPEILEITGILLAGALTWAAATAKRKWGIEIEAKHRDALHSALMTGARLAAAKELTGAAATQLVLDYVRGSVPDAIGKLDPSQGKLAQMAEAKMQEVAQEVMSGVIRATTR